MGVFDTDGLFRDMSRNVGLHGNLDVAETWMKPAMKIVEVMQGILDLGHNEGMRTASYQLAPDTSMKVTISPGAMEPIARVDITSDFPEPGEEKLRSKKPPMTQCPRLPLGRPGLRMFSQLFGVNIADGQNDQQWVIKRVPIVQTPHISPTLEQGEYCGGGSTQRHGEITLERPFRFAGGIWGKVYVHRGWLGFKAPQAGLNFDQSVAAKNAPCTIDAPGFPTSVPNIDALFPGNSVAITSTGKVTACQSVFEGEVALIEGSAIFGINELVAGGAEIITGKRAVAEQLDQDDPGGQFAAGSSFSGEPRQFAVFDFGGGLEFDLSQQSEGQIVLLYESALCPAAVGFFYGGVDGFKEFEIQDFILALDKNPPCGGLWLSAQLCDVISNCDAGGTAGPGATCATPRCGIPVNFGGYLIGEDRRGLGWIQGDGTSQIYDPGWKKCISSRSFWFELDGDGFPNGRGLHNGPLIAPNIEDLQLRNAADLAFPGRSSA